MSKKEEEEEEEGEKLLRFLLIDYYSNLNYGVHIPVIPPPSIRITVIKY